MKSKQKKKESRSQKYGSKDAALAAFRAWQEAHAEEIDDVNSRRLESSLGKVAALAAKARATAMGAMPAWADPKAIEAVYVEAARLGLEVDHVIPLRGELANGLHVTENLRLLTKLENQQKGNRYEVD